MNHYHYLFKRLTHKGNHSRDIGYEPIAITDNYYLQHLPASSQRTSFQPHVWFLFYSSKNSLKLCALTLEAHAWDNFEHTSKRKHLVATYNSRIGHKDY